MPRFLLVAAAVLAGTLGLIAQSAEAAKRVAFVVGTDRYDNLDATRQLQRAVNDARSVAAAFKALGFDVIAEENVTRGQFNAQWQRFLDRLDAGDTAALYYAGHGVEIEGLNFLLPRDIPDIKFGRQEQIKRESLSVAEILLDLRGRNPEIALIILDACRDNPLIPDEVRSASGTRGGLAPVKGEPPKGTFVMYSAGAGESALDRLPGSDPDRLNSIFTRRLVPLLAAKGLALHDMARQLRAEVIELAATVPHVQRPAYYDGVIGKYCLAGCEGGGAQIGKGRVTSDVQHLGEAAAAWKSLRTTTKPADLEAFAARYGETYFADLARARLDELMKQKQQASIKKDEDRKPVGDAARAKSQQGGAWQEASSAWVKLCENARDGKSSVKICMTLHERLDGNTGATQISAAVRKIEGQDKLHFMIMLPNDIVLKAGLRATFVPRDIWHAAHKGEKVDEKRLSEFRLEFSNCHPSGCNAEMEVTPELLSKMLTSGGFMVVFLNPGGQRSILPVPLAGFEAAYLGGPIDNQKYAEQRRQLMAEIEKRKASVGAAGGKK